MKNKRNFNIYKALYRYFIFFVTVAFLVTCSTALFVSVLSKTLAIELTGDNLQSAGKITFVNVLALSLLFTVCDALRRKFTVQKSAKRIIEGTEKIVKGDFNVRIQPLATWGMDETWNELIACFNRIAEELSGIETLRSDFIANVSHEMKTPLAVIQNYATLLKEPGLTEEKRQEYAQGISDGVRRLSDMMSNILKLNRLENQQILSQNKRYNLAEQLYLCLLQFESVWEKKNIEIVTDIPDEVEIEADEELLSLVWNNLLSNAFKFTPDGGRVEVTLSKKDEFAVVKVSDTGCGMSPEVGARIFEKFYQGDSSRATQGNGLGLALVKRVVDIMQGEISVQSKEGEGSVFSVSFRRGG